MINLGISSRIIYSPYARRQIELWISKHLDNSIFNSDNLFIKLFEYRGINPNESYMMDIKDEKTQLYSLINSKNKEYEINLKDNGEIHVKEAIENGYINYNYYISETNDFSIDVLISEQNNNGEIFNIFDFPEFLSIKLENKDRKLVLKIKDQCVNNRFEKKELNELPYLIDLNSSLLGIILILKEVLNKYSNYKIEFETTEIYFRLELKVGNNPILVYRTRSASIIFDENILKTETPQDQSFITLPMTLEIMIAEINLILNELNISLQNEFEKKER